MAEMAMSWQQINTFLLIFDTVVMIQYEDCLCHDNLEPPLYTKTSIAWSRETLYEQEDLSFQITLTYINKTEDWLNRLRVGLAQARG